MPPPAPVTAATLPSNMPAIRYSSLAFSTIAIKR